jgi:transcriptional regulator with XRE-family HTH domain
MEEIRGLREVFPGPEENRRPSPSGFLGEGRTVSPHFSALHAPNFHESQNLNACPHLHPLPSPLHSDPMDSHDVLRRAIEKESTSPKEVAAALGLSLSLIYKWTERQSNEGSGSRNPLDRLLAFIATTDDRRILEWLCQRCGGYFVPNPKNKGNDYEVLPATQAIISQFSALLHEISKAAADNRITAEEAEEIRESWDSLKSYTEGFVACCEEGNFDELRKMRPPQKANASPSGPA